MTIFEQIQKIIEGDIASDENTLLEYSHDASIFEIKPRLVVYPKGTADVRNLVRFVSEKKKEDTTLSLTARGAGTDMSGGAINDSIILSFTRYFNHIKDFVGNEITAEPGVFYRDLEKETLKRGLIFPSYPASRELCTIGGIVNNNAGGEKSLSYGKTENYVKRLKVVLCDANEYEIHPLSKEQLEKKIKQGDFEGEIYRKMYELISKNYALLQDAKPKVSKNSAGYALWNVYDRKNEIFDLCKLFVGAQGTLGIITEATLSLVPVKKYAEMVIVFLHDLAALGEIVNRVLLEKPDTFEVYDDNTLKLALRFFYEFAKNLGTKNIVKVAFSFLPEFLLILRGGLPKLVLQIDFQSDDQNELAEKVARLKQALLPFHPDIRIAKNKAEEQKYWLIRRESFNLLRKKIKNLHTAPFIDDFIVPQDAFPQFLSELNKILSDYKNLVYTIAGHIGDGNLHIIPLMDLSSPNFAEIIKEISDRVYDLVIKYGGSITAEHNDGIIRTPYLEKMYGRQVTALFEETKKIFDPQNIFNPRKKVNGTLPFAFSHIRKNW